MAEDRIAQLERAIKKMDLVAEVALCSFRLGAIREYVKDIRRFAAEVGVQGGIHRHDQPDEGRPHERRIP